MRCEQCELMRINGIVCHERGCPLSHVGTLRECKWCGSEFAPEERGQQFCESSCYLAYNGLPDECEEPLPEEMYEHDE